MANGFFEHAFYPCCRACFHLNKYCGHGHTESFPLRHFQRTNAKAAHLVTGAGLMASTRSVSILRFQDSYFNRDLIPTSIELMCLDTPHFLVLHQEQLSLIYYCSASTSDAPVSEKKIWNGKHERGRKDGQTKLDSSNMLRPCRTTPPSCKKEKQKKSKWRKPKVESICAQLKEKRP